MSVLPNIETLHRLLEQAPGFIVFTDQDMNILYLNRTAHGFAMEDTIGTNFKEFLTPEQGRKVSEAFQRVFETGEEQHVESFLDTPQSGRRWMSTRISLMRDTDGQVMGFVNFTSEVTEQKQSELALEQTRNELLEASHRAGMAEVATGVLHNVGNVLNSLMVSARMAEELLHRSRVGLLGEAVAKLEQQRDDLASFLTEDAQGAKFPLLLRRIADELLQERERMQAELARVNQQVDLIQATIAAQQAFAKTDSFVQEVELGSLIERIVSMFRIEFESRAIALQTDITPGLVCLDTQATLQILANLVRNAIEALEETDAQTAQSGRLLLRASAQDGQVIIEVEDNGCGIPEAVQANIFQHGFTTKLKGHGFGLHTSSIAAQSMGGALTAHSEGPGRGARFRLDLPNRRPANRLSSHP
jgi:PAS domain S-box-containing protein